MRLKDRVAIVTGGAKGIGEGCVRVFAREGAKTVIADIDDESGERLAAELSALKQEVAYVRTDVTDVRAIERLIRETVARYGALHILLNNAGTHIPKGIEQLSDEEFDFLVNLNLKSVFRCSKLALAELKKTKGVIINMASMVGIVGQANAAGYVATKGAVIALTKAMALDLARDGIRVNAICPSAVRTPLLEEWRLKQPDPDAIQRMLDDMHPLGRMAEPEEIGRVALFLATEDSSFIAGAAIPVEGGSTLDY